jgi:hypothetical protein
MSKTYCGKRPEILRDKLSLIFVLKTNFWRSVCRKNKMLYKASRKSSLLFERKETVYLRKK